MIFLMKFRMLMMITEKRRDGCSNPSMTFAYRANEHGWQISRVRFSYIRSEINSLIAKVTNKNNGQIVNLTSYKISFASYS